MRIIQIIWMVVVFLSLHGWAAGTPRSMSQADYERESQAVVRNKLYYKPGKFEVTGTAGLLPYDDINNQYFVGGKLSWHMSDTWGWEVIDVQKAFSSVTAWATNLVKSKQISNLQTPRLNYSISSNLLFSPFYGKLRIFGSSLVYFDIYSALGLGFAGTETLKLSNTAPNESTVRTGFDPMINFGVGFKFFLNRYMGLVIDLRDYLVFAENYGQRSPKSNYTAMVGLNFFLPSF